MPNPHAHSGVVPIVSLSSAQARGDVAIIGMSGAFPGAQTIEGFYSSLLEGRELIRFLAAEDFGDRKAKSSRPGFVPAVAAMDDIECFDAPFFGMTAEEAELTDPQHRVLLEHCWRAMENAGYDTARYSRPVGVFAGCTINTYLMRNILGNPRVVESVDPLQLNIAGSCDFLTTRISYKMGLKGPSHTVQSACSTSLVAVHCGCRSLLDMECDMALAGGVSINVDLLRGYRYQDGGIMSPDGHCRVFDAKAGGTVFGSGVGVVVLKRMEDAVNDGDNIYAVIKGSAVNNDGNLKVGYATPSVEGQAEVVAEAIASAGINPESVGYIECHGTGTLLGDPVEVRALTKAFRAVTNRRHFCAIGSVKSNIGHLDAAAGAAGLIKAVLSVKHGMLTPSLHFDEPNPQIEFADSPFYVNTKATRWRNEGGLRCAGVSAFGVGGTNAHVVLEEAPSREQPGQKRYPYLLPLAARTPIALGQMLKNLASHLRQNTNIDMADVAYTLQMGRRQFSYRWAGLCGNRDEAIALLERDSAAQNAEETAKESRRLCLLFPGEDSECINKGRELYEKEPVFLQAMDRCREILQSRFGTDFSLALLREKPFDSDRSMAQPAVLSMEWAIAQLWRSWGVEGYAVMGFGVGEYTAACLAGVMTLEDALTMAVIRGSSPQEPASLDAVRTIRFKRPLIKCISGATGTSILDSEVRDPDYWVTHLRLPLRVAKDLSEVRANENWVLLQVGPGQSLRRILDEQGLSASMVVSMAESAAESEVARMAATAGRLWCAGFDLNWAGMQAGTRAQRVALPTYPFERKRHWIEPASVPVPSLEEERFAPAATSETDANYAPRPLLRNSYVAPENEAESKAVAILEKALGIRPVGVTDRYGELGGDSLTAVRIIDQLNIAFESRLRVVDLYEGLAIRDLVRLTGNEASGVGENDQNSGSNDKRRLYQQRRQSRRQTEPA
jgi:acyl transferase domain-containing protein